MSKIRMGMSLKTLFLTFAGATIVIGLMLAWLLWYDSTESGVKKQLTDSWDIDLPTDAEMIYSLRWMPALGGRDTYAVFDCMVTPAKVLSRCLDEKDEMFEKIFEVALGRIQSGAEETVGEAYRPDWSAEYLWFFSEQTEGTIYLVYSTPTMRLYVLEDLTTHR